MQTLFNRSRTKNTRITPSLPFLVLLFPFLLSAQDKQPARRFSDLFYLEAQVGLLLTGEYITNQVNLGTGFRINQHHSLGAQLQIFGEHDVSTNRSVKGVGLLYRYKLKHWLIDVSSGYVYRFAYQDDFYIIPEVLEDQPHPFYFRLGLHYRTRVGLTYGISYAQSGKFWVRYTDTEAVPPEIQLHKYRGPQAFSIDVGFLIQRDSR